ncbi:MAG: flippase-like domain-containing protein [Anaerolineae bacterium]|nr:flippase-like domain-containing protein [Anaerolineae bacterium]
MRIRFSRASLWISVKIFLAFGLLALLLSRTSFAEIATALQGAAPLWLAASFVIFCANIYVMARRYWLLIEKAPPFPSLLSLVVIQTLFTNLVASGAGAVSYVGMLRGKHKVSARKSIASLVAARIGDAVILWITLAYSSWLVWEQIQPLHWLIIGILTGLTSLFVFGALVLCFHKRIAKRAEWLIYRMHLNHVSPVKDLNRAFAAIAEISVSDLVRVGMAVTGWSALLGLLHIAFGFCNMQIFHISVAPAAVLFTVTLVRLISLLPIQAFGGLGVNEVTAITLYGYFGVDITLLAPALFGMRVLYYAFNFCALIYLPFEKELEARTG